MNPALAGVALAVVVGAVVAGSARDARTAIFGLVVAMLGVARSWPIRLPAPLGLAARLVGAVLAGYLLWIAARGHGVRTGGSLVGWPTDAFLAAGGGRRRVRQPRPRCAGRRTAGSLRRPGSRWPPWPSCRS